MEILSNARKTPPEAKIIGDVAGLLLLAIEKDVHAEHGISPGYEVAFRRFADDPSTLQAMQGCNPDGLKNATIHSLLMHLSNETCLSEDGLASVRARSEPWAPLLADYGMAVRITVEKFLGQRGRMPMTDHTILVAVDGSRLSYLALEVAAQFRKHGNLVLLNIQEGEAAPRDLEPAFLEEDLVHRCQHQFKLRSHQFRVISERLAGRRMQDVIAGAMADNKANILVVGAYGNGGPRTGLLGEHAVWSATAVDEMAVIANPYTAPSLNGVPNRSSLFMVAINAEKPLNKEAVVATMQLMSHWNQIIVMILLTESQTKAAEVEPDKSTKLVDEMSKLLADAQVQGTVRIVKFVATKTPEQQILNATETDRVDFLALDRFDGWHIDCLKFGRATVIIVPKVGPPSL